MKARAGVNGESGRGPIAVCLASSAAREPAILIADGLSSGNCAFRIAALTFRLPATQQPAPGRGYRLLTALFPAGARMRRRCGMTLRGGGMRLAGGSSGAW